MAYDYHTHTHQDITGRMRTHTHLCYSGVHTHEYLADPELLKQSRENREKQERYERVLLGQVLDSDVSEMYTEFAAMATKMSTPGLERILDGKDRYERLDWIEQQAAAAISDELAYRMG